MHGDKKVYLNLDSLKRLYRLENTDNTEEIINELKSRSPKLKIQVMPIGRNYFLLASRSDTSVIFPESKKIKFQIPVYITKRTGFTYFFDGRIMLKPRKGVTIEEILNQKSGIKLLDKLSSGIHFLAVEEGEKVLTIANQIYESGLVEACLPNYLAPIVQHHIPTDPNYANQYYLNNTGQSGGTPGIDIKAQGAWDKTLGCNIRVAVIDDGVENHADIAGRVLTGYTPSDPVSGNGRPAFLCDVYGTPPSIKRVGHGMACAGIIAASHNNIGIAGVAPNSLIYPVNVFAGGRSVTEVVSGIHNAWSASYGDADVISCSWGYDKTAEEDPLITAEIIAARTSGRVRGGIARGCVVVFSSGNNHGDFPGVVYPANVTGVISVGAVDHNGNIHSYSSRGGDLKLVAPSGGASGSADIGGCLIPSGGNIWTTDRPGTNGYSSGDYFGGFNGTSAAAPQVAGVAALVLSVNPNLSESDVRILLSQTATDLGTSGYDHTYGYGLVNAEKAVEMALGGPISGQNPLCSTATYSLANTPPGAVSWLAYGTISINSSTGAATTSSDGLGSVKAVISSGCGTVYLTRQIHTGGPYKDDITAETDYIGSGLNVLAPYNETEIRTTYAGPGTILENDVQIWDHSDWSVDYKTASRFILDYWHTPTPSSQTIYIRKRNSCGWGLYKETNWTFSSFFAKYTISPNPASGFVTLLFEDLIDPKGLPAFLELMHESSTIPVRTLKVPRADFDNIKNNSNKLSIDVRDLPRGTYYLHVGYGDKKKPDMHRILLE